MPRCTVTDDNIDSTGNAVAPGFYAGRSGRDDGGPRARTRGSHAGFIPDALAAQLRASAASGNGFAALSHPAPRRDGLLLLLALTGLFLAFRNSRTP